MLEQLLLVLLHRQEVVQGQVVLELLEEEEVLSELVVWVHTEVGLAELEIVFVEVGKNLYHPVPLRRHEQRLKQVDTLYQFEVQEKNMLLVFSSTHSKN